MSMDLGAARLAVLRAAAMFDGVSPTLVAGPLVVIAGRAIVAVHGPAGPVPPGAAVIDLPGLTLMPGLIDTHLHLCFDATADPGGHLAQADDDILRQQMAEAAQPALPAAVTPAPALPARPYPP